MSAPLRRRLLAAVLLFFFSIGSALFWTDGAFDWTILGANLIAATMGFGYLHYRWRAQERRAMTPERVRDIFS